MFKNSGSGRNNEKMAELKEVEHSISMLQGRARLGTTIQYKCWVPGKRALWKAAYAPGDGQTSPAYSSQSVQYLYINHLLSVNKLVLSYLLLR